MYQILDKLSGSDYYIGMEVDEMILCVGNKDGITKVSCPKCGTPMNEIDDGYSESFSHGEYDQRENGSHWECPKCGYCEVE